MPSRHNLKMEVKIMNKTAEKIAQTLGLEPLVGEGGLYKSTYQSDLKIGETVAASGIYFMLTGEGYSHLHRLPKDEMYHFYKGDAVELVELLPDGTHKVVILGQDITAGEQVQYLVKAGSWQGSKLRIGGEFALMGTTMTPAYEDSDYEHAKDINALINQYPKAKKEIQKVTGEVKFK